MLTNYINFFKDFYIYASHLQFYNTIIESSAVIVLWSSLHFFIPRIYINICVPSSLYGFILSPFKAFSPECIALRWLNDSAINSIGIIKTTLCYYFIRSINYSNNILGNSGNSN